MDGELIFLKGFAQGRQYYEMTKSIQVALELHEGQTRKGGGDYITHPTRVCYELVCLRIYDEDILTAAFLHDVVEDCAVTRNQLTAKHGFKPRAVAIVDLLTKSDSISTELYYKNISEDIGASLVKISDRCHNISTMADAFTIEKMKSYIEETEMYVYPLCKYVINHYPVHADQVAVMRNHIESVVDSLKGTIKIIEDLKLNR